MALERKVPGSALGTEAKNQGGPSANESIPLDQRNPASKPELDAGQKVDPKTGNLLPARYATNRKGADGELNIREDR